MTKSVKILAATSNTHKLLELQTIARDFGISMIAPDDVKKKQCLDPLPPIVETGKTYRENALLKATIYRDWSGLDALGDDSGLEVVVLDNRPGLHSARYAGEHATDSQRIQKLLFELDEQEKRSDSPIDRSACYVCSLALVFADSGGNKSQNVMFADSTLRGSILATPRGDRGFGYDAIVYLPSLGKTLAEVDFHVTCTQGFRALAARKLFRELCSART